MFVRHGWKWARTCLKLLLLNQFVDCPATFLVVQRETRDFQLHSFQLWLPPEQFGEMGFTMSLYSTSILFRCTWAIQKATAGLRAGRPLEKEKSVNMETFEKIVELEKWQGIEKKVSVRGITEQLPPLLFK